MYMVSFFIVLYLNYCFKILTNILHRCLVHVCAFCIQQYQIFFKYSSKLENNKEEI